MTDANYLTKLEWIRLALERYEGPLTRYAARITGDPELARDVVQETFLRLCSQDRAEVDGRLAEWLFTVCRNRAVDVRRKEGRMKPLNQITAESCEASDAGPSKAVENRETTGKVQRVIAMLPENQQEVIRLRFQNSLSYREISKVTSLSVTNVGYLIHTAIKTIQKRLGAGPSAASKTAGGMS